MLPTCLENLHLCNASCCKEIVFYASKLVQGNEFPIGYMTLDRKQYYLLHNLKVNLNRQRRHVVVVPKDLMKTFKRESINKTTDKVTIPIRCSALTDNNKCILHEVGMKPRLCKDLNWETASSEKYLLTSGCMFAYPKEKASEIIEYESK